MQNARYSCPNLMKLNFLDRLSKNAHISMSNADGRTDKFNVTKLIVAVRHFANAPNENVL